MTDTLRIELLQTFNDGSAALRINGVECSLSNAGRFSRFADWATGPDALRAVGAARRKFFQGCYGHEEYYATPKALRAIEAAKAVAL